jgi:hypothetical protein
MDFVDVVDAVDRLSTQVHRVHSVHQVHKSPRPGYSSPFNLSYPALLTGMRVPSLSSATRLSFA